jgi:hypothetical protein
MRFAWGNLGLGVAWPKTLARSGRLAVIGEPRVKFGSSPGGAEADKTESGSHHISPAVETHPSFKLPSVLTQLYPNHLDAHCVARLIRSWRHVSVSPAACSEFRQVKAERPLAGDHGCAESQKY